MKSVRLRSRIAPVACVAAAAALGALTAGPQSAFATSYPSIEERGLTTTSTLVVRGQILSKTTQYLGGPERKQKLATLYTITVVEVLKGTLTVGEADEARVVIGLPGGELGEIGQRVSGVPALAIDDEYVLFLGPPSGPGGARGVVGHALGTYRVTARGHLLPDREYGGHPSIPRRLELLRAALGVSDGALPGAAPAPRLPGGSPPAAAVDP